MTMTWKTIKFYSFAMSERSTLCFLSLIHFLSNFTEYQVFTVEEQYSQTRRFNMDVKWSNSKISCFIPVVVIRQSNSAAV